MPGPGAASKKEQVAQEAQDYSHYQTMQDLRGAFGDPGDEFQSKYLGRSYKFKLTPPAPAESYEEQLRRQRIDQLMAVKKFMVGM